MSLRITVRSTLVDVTVVALAGQATIGEGTSSLRESIRELVSMGHRKIVLDVSGVTRLDSSGIGELVSAANIAQVRILDPLGNVRKVLRSARVEDYFTIRESEAAAVDSFQG